MNSPPNSLIVEMTEKDVQDNLASIVDSMERIRQESIANLGASDEQKMDYLRLTGELAGCIKAFIKENCLEEHVASIMGLVNTNLLLRRYDSLQQDFWNEHEPMLKTALDNASAVLLRDDFVSESQPYHVFQALKYLTIRDGVEREDVYETILPINSLLSECSLHCPEISYYLMKKLLGKAVSDGVGVKVDVDVGSFVRNLEQTGALYVDVSKEHYQTMKKQFPKTILVGETGQSYTRVIFGSKKAEFGFNVFKQLQDFAKLDLGGAEESLVKKMGNFYGFGKKFLEAMKGRIGINKSGTKLPDGLEAKVAVVLDELPADNGNKKVQDEWFGYWNKAKDGRVMASMGDLYIAFKELKRMHETGTEEEKAKAQALRNSLQKDFDWTGKKNWLISSTRIVYSKDSLNAKITQHYQCNKPELLKETALEIPVYQRIPITLVVGDPLGLAYLQNLLDTGDDGETIISALEFISNKNKGNITVWAPDQDGRKNYPDRAAGLDYGYGEFRVDGNDIGTQGRSRGVVVCPAGVALKNEHKKS